MRRRLWILGAAFCLSPMCTAAAQCPGDLDDDATVGITDFLTLLGQWGPGGGPADLDGDGQVGIQDFLMLLGVWGPCPEPPIYALPPTIVVYNLNYPDLDGNQINDALEIAQYYVSARGIDPSALCGVNLPTSEFATPDELLAARQTIIENCICSVVSQDVQDATGCDIGNPGAVESIRDASPISHMVLIRGIPVRLFSVNWPDQTESDKQAPSFGLYLSYLIYHDADIFSDVGLIETPPYPLVTDSSLGYVPPLVPADHHMPAHGYIVAMTKQRTFDLIDRTLAAEHAGVRGNFLLEGAEPFFYELTSTFDSACVDYLSHEPFVFGDPANSWPYWLCRVGSTGSSAAGAVIDVPGKTGSTIPFAIDGGLLYGRTSVPGFSAFSGFGVMKNWHLADEGCVELCRQLPTQQEQDDCRANSTDYFRELNTDCVGVARGFMAYQLSSFAVQYYGFTPPGWTLSQQSSFTKSMPVVAHGDAYVDGGDFTDDSYAHYGVYSHLAPDMSTCGNGPCPAHIPVVLAAQIDVDDVSLDGVEKHHTLQFRYRYTETPASPPAQMWLRLLYTRTSGLIRNSAVVAVPIVDSGGGWNTVSQDFMVGPIAGDSIDEIRVRLWSSADDGITGYIDLDGFELIDADTLANVFPVDVGSFTEDRKEFTEKGDWAANVIDRMGGIANWGTSSHHVSGASSSGGGFPGAFFAGRTLGEALAHANDAGPSGIVYGDPLYRPAAAKLYAATFTPGTQHDHLGDRAGYNVWSDTYQALDLRANVLHGTDNLETTSWELFTCPDLGIAECDGNWTSYLQGTGAVEGLDLGTLDAFIDVGQDQALTLKLRVWNAGEEGDDLANYVYFNYRAHPRPDCPGDANGDGVVDEEDEDELLFLWGPSWFCAQTCPLVGGFCIADVNQDGMVDIQDWLLVINAEGPCEDPDDCPEDVNGDDVIDQLDVDLVELYWDFNNVCPVAYEDCPVDVNTGFCVFDFDQDGDVDEDDHVAMLNLYWGPCPL